MAWAVQKLTYMQTEHHKPDPSAGMRTRFLREVAEAGLSHGPGSQTPVVEADLAALPAPAQRYLRFMEVLGRPRTWSIRARWTGGFRMRPDRPLQPCEVWQYDSSLEIARIFHMQVRLFGLLPVVVRDTYLRGCGRMLGRALDTFTIVDETNYKLDLGELCTYLNDAILLAPSMLLGPNTSWSGVDDRSFDVALTDHKLTVNARVFVDEHGAVTDFSTTDRYGRDPAGPNELIKTRWSTPIAGWMKFRGWMVPKNGKAVWHFPSGDFTYADFSLAPGDLEFDVSPVAAAESPRRLSYAPTAQ
jgi:hypothetical protein